MRKLLLLLIALLTGVSGAWAIDVVISDQTNLNTITSSNFSSTAVHKYGTYSAPAGGTTFTSNSTSGLSGVTITSTANIVKPFYYSGNNYKYGLAFKPADTETYTITISAPENYVIVGYTMKAISTTSNQQFQVVASSGEYTVTSSHNYITGRVNSQTATFTIKNTLNNATTANAELCLPFFTITVLPAAASKATNVSDISKSKTYLIHSIDYSESDKSRGYLSATSNYLACTSKTGNWAPGSFAFVQYDGKYFLYDVANKKFARTENYSSNSAEVKGIETNTSILPVTFDKISDGVFKIKMGVNYMNFSSSYTYGLTINYYSTNDAGNNLELIENGSFDDTEAIATLEAYLANPTIVNGDKYKIKLNGTSFYVSKDNSGNAKTETTASELVISENGTNAAGKKAYSIKDAGTNKYLSYTDITYSNGSNSRLSWADTDANSKFVFTQGSGGYSSNVLIRPADACDNNYVTSWNQYYSDQIFVFWTLSDAMSYWTLEKVTKTVTYNLKWNGSTIQTNSSVNAHIGGAAADDVPWDVPAYCNFTCDVETIGESTTEVNVTMTWNGPFEFSTDFASAKWYYLKLNNKYVYYDTESTNLLFSNDKVEDPKALWAFFGNPYDGVKVANLSVGDGLFISNDDPATMHASSFVENKIGSNAYGFYLRDKDYDCFIGDNGSGHVLMVAAEGSEASSNVTMKVEPYIVTYNLKFGGSTIATKTLDKVTGDSEDLFPSEWARDFCEYSYDPEEIGNSTTSVDVTMTWNGPFDISADYENAVWYYLAVNGKWGKNSSSGYLNAPDISSDIADVKGADDGQWAFFGNPYDGFLLSLKEKYMSTIQVYLSSQLAAPAFGNATGSTEKWTVTGSGSTFTLNCGDKYIVDNSTTMGFKTTALEGSEGTFSVRSYYCQKGLDDFADYVGESTDKYFGVTQSSVTNVNNMIAGMLPKMTEAQYTEYFTDLYNSFKGYISFNWPETGYYRIKNNNSGDYIGYGKPEGLTGGQLEKTAGLVAITSANVASDYSTVVRLTKVSATLNTGVYTIATQGLNVQGTPSANAVYTASDSDPVQFKFVVDGTPGIVYIKDSNASGSGDATEGCLHEANWTESHTLNGIVPYIHGAAPSKWVAEDVDEISIALNGPVGGYRYATLCVPFDVTLDEEAAYTLSLNANKDALTLSSASNEIAAGTPVLLRDESSSLTATIGTGYAAAPLTSTSLTGVYVDTQVSGTNYFLGVYSDEIGFYHWGEGTQTLDANRAYFEASKLSAAVKGLSLIWDEETGINSIENGKLKIENEAVYDLSGRRVAKPTKGLYIKNGKKMVIK